MKTKLDKFLRIIAAAVFVVALGLNVSTSLNGSLVNSALLAQTTGTPPGSGDSGVTGGTDVTFKHPAKQTITMNVERITYKKWDAEARIWIFSSIGGEGYIQETIRYSYFCCLAGGMGCNYDDCSGT